MSTVSRCGYVAIVGRPNVGKSTLLNCLIGTKVSITSAKPQTTRFQILGIKTRKASQVVYIDTPGLHSDEKSAMNRYMNRLASAVIPDAQVIVFVVEAMKWTDDDNLVLSKLKETKAPVLLVVNKIDTVGDKKELLPFLDEVKDKFPFTQIIPVSATRAENLVGLEDEIDKYLPESPHLFPDEQVTDKNVKFQVAEIVREKLIQATEQEVPYCTTVEVEDWKTEEKRIEISVLIWVEREGQKLIVIGKKGERLKWIGIEARKEIEALLKQRVFLRLWVKVKERWTDDDRALRQLGYS
jgi:GTP-binding protein Era